MGHFSGNDMALIQGIHRILILNRRIVRGAREQQTEDQYDATCTHEFFCANQYREVGSSAALFRE